MPPHIDIYGLSDARDLPTLEAFVDAFGDRAATENRDGEELMLRPLAGDPTELSDYDWEPCASLAAAMARGLAYPRRSFSVYLKSRHPEVAQAIICFTIDDRIVLGLSVEETADLRVVQALAQQLLTAHRCRLALAVAEEPPPSSEESFLSLARQPRVLFSHHA